MGWWQRQFGSSTRGRIVALLRRGDRSVDELAASLELTDNAVRAQLTTLQRDGMVQATGVRHDGTVGKPATIFGMTASAQPILSAAYAPLLASLVAELGTRMSPAQLESILRAAGRRLAPAPAAGASLGARARAGAGFLAELGADADLVRTADGYEIRSHGCIVSEAVAACPATCHAVEALLAELTGAPVTECCERTGVPSCRFAIARSD